MYHLLKLLRENSSQSSQAKLIANKDEEIRNSALDKHSKRLLLIFGILEIAPFLIGLVLSITLNKIFIKFDYLIIGLVITILLSLTFKSKLPDIPIGLNHKSKK